MTERNRGIGRQLFSIVGMLVVALIAVVLNLLMSRVNLRWDFTEDQLYSLSKGTEAILASLETPVTVKVFYSESAANLPTPLKTYARRALDFLGEYRHRAPGRVIIERFDPAPDSDAEEWAQKYGIQAMRLADGDPFYFGILVTAADREQVIPFLDPARERNLEYDLTRAIADVQRDRKAKITIISDLPVFGQPAMAMGGASQGSPPWTFIKELKKSYTVAPVAPGSDDIPADTDLLILLQAKNLSETMLYAIDQYVMRGGRLMVFADPFSVVERMPSPSATFPLQRLLTAWGVQMDPSKIVADFSFATTLHGRDNQAEENPLWLSIKPTGMNQEQIITARLESLLIPVAGAVSPTQDSGYEYEPLLQSSTNAQLVDRYMLRLGNEELRRRFHPEGKPLDLAARIRGTFNSAFPDGPPRQSEDAGAEEPPKSLTAAQAEHLAKGEKPATILVVADADLLFDPFYIEQQNFLGFALSHVFNDNLNFMLNSCESLTGSDALISIRTRGRFERPFLRVEKLRQKAQNQWLEREQQLMAKAEETNQKLNELQHRTDPSQQLLLTRDQAAEIQKFSEEKRRINHELKQVRRSLRVDIERLGTTVKFINIYLIPLLVCGAGLLFALFRRRRRTRPL